MAGDTMSVDSNQSSTIARFDVLYMHDSWLDRIEIRTGGKEVLLSLDWVKVLKNAEADPFDPLETIKPALLRLTDVRSVQFEGVDADCAYQLNACVVYDSVAPCESSEFLEFTFIMTGGFNQDGSMVKLKVVAKDFQLERLGSKSPG